MKQNKLKLPAVLFALLLAVLMFPTTVLASEEWPSDISIEADAGIVMDADSGTVLYGKNIHETYAPASITKVLTAILALEHCGLDETVTFSKNAVYNVEPGSSSAGYDTGDEASVKDCLYALLLKSANESANALAEHISGSTEEFAELMNEKAKELGCVDSHFSNPSGLNDEEHYVSAYDMALITRYAFQNETFCEIVSTTYYELPPNGRSPEGLGISPGNKMVKKNFPEYRPEVIGGKTGYTSIARNTLVIGAEKEDMRLITVVLHSSGTTYSDTSQILDFGFDNFRSVPIEGNDTTFSSLGDDLTIAGLPTSSSPPLSIDPDSRIVLPNTADFDDTTASVSFDLPAQAPAGAMAAVTYSLGERPVGTAWLTVGETTEKELRAIPEELLNTAPTSIAQINPEAETAEETEEADRMQEESGPALSPMSEENPQEAPSPDKKTSQDQNQAPGHGGLNLKAALTQPAALLLPGGLALAAVCLLFFTSFRKKQRFEESERLERRRKRLERLKESGVSEDEFNEMVQSRRLSIPLESEGHFRKGKKGAGKRKGRSSRSGISFRKRSWRKR